MKTNHGKRKKAGTVATQASLAAAMQRHYGNSIRILINRHLLNHWFNGRRLTVRGMDVEPPPARTGPGFVVADWIAWFDKNLLSYYRIRTGEESNASLSNDDLIELERRDKIESLQHKRIKRERDMGLWVKVADVEREVDAIGTRLNAMLDQQYGKLFESEMVTAINACQELGIYRESVKQKLINVSRQSTDAIKEALSSWLSEMSTAAQCTSEQLELNAD